MSGIICKCFAFAIPSSLPIGYGIGITPVWLLILTKVGL